MGEQTSLDTPHQPCYLVCELHGILFDYVFFGYKTIQGDAIKIRYLNYLIKKIPKFCIPLLQEHLVLSQEAHIYIIYLDS